MLGNMFQIGRSGAAASRASLEVTSQNIANAANPDYARRSLDTRELVGQSLGGPGMLNGIWIDGVARFDSAVAQQQARTSASELARADAELAGLRNTETALEQAKLFEGLVEFEAVLTQLEGNPLEPALRTSALESARQLASTIRFANTALSTARGQVQEATAIELDKVNLQTAELARINRGLASARDGTIGQASLLDARDAALRDLSALVGVDTSFDERGAVTVRLRDGSGSPGPLMVDGVTTNALASTTAADGTLSFAVGGAPATLSTGSLAGRAAALDAQADYQIQLDTIAAEVIARSNTAQGNGVDANGNAGQPLFSGTNATNIALALTGSSQLATAPAGSPAGSTNTDNLNSLIASLGAANGPIAGSDSLLLGLSTRIAAQDVTRSGLAAIAENAEATLLAQTGVDLDAEAADLVRLQQAFEANSRVMQVATEIFDTLLGLR